MLLLAPAFAAHPVPTPGTWGVRMEAISLTRAPVLDVVESRLVIWAVAELWLGEDGWTQSHRVCEVQAEGTSRFVRTIIPAEYVAHIPYREVHPGTVAAAGMRSWEVDLGPVPVGYDPAASPGGPPASVDHPAVTDWDEDGRPGATVLVDIPFFDPFELWVAQTARMKLHGQVVDVDRIEGALEVSEQQRSTLGASNRLFARDAETWSKPDASTFLMLRLPADSSCADVRALMEAG